MVGTIGVSFFIFVWATGVVLAFLIKKRLKERYPEMHAELFAPSLLEHNVKKSLKFQSFALRSAKWSKIDDQQLILWLKLHRVCFSLLIGFFAMVLLVVFVGLAYYAITGQK
ncbi:hypothetical protein ACQUWM_01560 [Marinobacter sp. DUT-3]|uniref:hypothetical protein n=1 Tax=Marinobacter sp. DUT-3 TaxID=3412036 RepID=UPI003D176B34